MKGVYVDLQDEQKEGLKTLKAKTDRPIRSLVAEGVAYVISKYLMRKDESPTSSSTLSKKETQS